MRKGRYGLQERRPYDNCLLHHSTEMPAAVDSEDSSAKGKAGSSCGTPSVCAISCKNTVHSLCCPRTIQVEPLCLGELTEGGPESPRTRAPSLIARITREKCRPRSGASIPKIVRRHRKAGHCRGQPDDPIDIVGSVVFSLSS